jgi:hypothetical protein
VNDWVTVRHVASLKQVSLNLILGIADGLSNNGADGNQNILSKT